MLCVFTYEEVNVPWSTLKSRKRGAQGHQNGPYLMTVELNKQSRTAHPIIKKDKN